MYSNFLQNIKYTDEFCIKPTTYSNVFPIVFCPLIKLTFGLVLNYRQTNMLTHDFEQFEER
jgi:hypothetical protein